MARLKCPICRRTHIQLLNNDLNMREKTRTTLNLNPLQPFTIFNHKTVKKEKTSAAKVCLGIMTAGTSLRFTGTKKGHNEYHCMDCGHRWIGK